MKKRHALFAVVTSFFLGFSVGRWAYPPAPVLPERMVRLPSTPSPIEREIDGDAHQGTLSVVRLPLLASDAAEVVYGRPAPLDATPPHEQGTLLFDTSTTECAAWRLRLPRDYGLVGTVAIQYLMESATTGEVVIGMADTASYQRGQRILCRQTVPDTLGKMGEISCGAESLAHALGGEETTLQFCRESADPQDTAQGQMRVIGVRVKYVPRGNAP